MPENNITTDLSKYDQDVVTPDQVNTCMEAFGAAAKKGWIDKIWALATVIVYASGIWILDRLRDRAERRGKQILQAEAHNAHQEDANTVVDGLVSKPKTKQLN